MMIEKELKYHKFWLKTAREYADQFSKDPRLKVCSIIVSSDFQKVLSIGVNGWEKGGTNTPDSLEPGVSGTIHSEVAALLKMDNKKLYPNSILYCTNAPCRVCSRCIVNVECISKVYYGDDYRDLSGINILRERGIVCEKIN